MAKRFLFRIFFMTRRNHFQVPQYSSVPPQTAVGVGITKPARVHRIRDCQYKLTNTRMHVVVAHLRRNTLNKGISAIIPPSTTPLNRIPAKYRRRPKLDHGPRIASPFHAGSCTSQSVLWESKSKETGWTHRAPREMGKYMYHRP